MSYLAVDNPEKLCRHAQRLLGEDLLPQKPMLIAEDFSFYQREVPGLFVFLGVLSEGYGEALHSNRFNFDERALLYGVEFYVRLLEGVLE